MSHVKVVLIESDGTKHAISAPIGMSVMQAAVDNLVPGIFGDCGGSCSCATCHAFVQSGWEAKLLPPGELEKSTLDGALGQRPNSRLTCQIIVSSELDGLTLLLPASQY